MGDQRLPLEQRIGSVRDGDTTDHGTPIGSTPLAVQPPRRLGMDTPHPLGGDTSQTPHPLGGDIVERLQKSGERPLCYCALFKGYAAEAIEAADEIERLMEDRNGWQATAAGLSVDISNAEDEIERLCEELADWQRTVRAHELQRTGAERYLTQRFNNSEVDAAHSHTKWETVKKFRNLPDALREIERLGKKVDTFLEGLSRDPIKTLRASERHTNQQNQEVRQQMSTNPDTIDPADRFRELLQEMGELVDDLVVNNIILLTEEGEELCTISGEEADAIERDAVEVFILDVLTNSAYPEVDDLLRRIAKNGQGRINSQQANELLSRVGKGEVVGTITLGGVEHDIIRRDS